MKMTRVAFPKNVPTFTQNAIYPDVQPYVPPEMTEGDFRLMIYQPLYNDFQ